MNVLLTNDELHEVRGGTQIFIADLAQALQDRGHRVAVYSWLCGSLADEMRVSGLSVVGDPLQCGFVPDIIHGQHHLATMTAITAFPGVPAVYHCHGYLPWQERPPAHPRIERYLAMADALVPWMAAVTGKKNEDVLVLPNSVNLSRFGRVRQLGPSPRHALLFGNAFIPPESVSRLRRACERGGMTLDLVGAQFGNAVSDPAGLLTQYDLVFAIGRSAMEAMASGCAVVIFSAYGCGPIMTPDLLTAMSGRNFTVPVEAPAISVRSLIAEVGKFHPGSASALTRLVRERYCFDHTCNRMAEIYTETIASWNARPHPSPAQESVAVSQYIGSLGPLIKGADERTARLRTQREKSRERTGRLKSKLAGLERRMKQARERLPRILWRMLFPQDD
jgi:glycosyltransferase involved in cell wall biosynthesis